MTIEATVQHLHLRRLSSTAAAVDRGHDVAAPRAAIDCGLRAFAVSTGPWLARNPAKKRAGLAGLRNVNKR
jgi:hypothetical protein